MGLRRPSAIPRQLLPLRPCSLRPSRLSYLGYNVSQRSGLATTVPPVTQDATSSKGPTAMVFLNMGGPSTTDEVEDFLSRLFVCFGTLSVAIPSMPVD